MINDHQRSLMELGYRTIVGIDEAGRGPLAGPVVAAAVYLPLDVDIPGLRDSKAMTPAARQRCFAAIHQVGAVGVGRASPQEIDAVNILQAALLAMYRAVDQLPLEPDLCLVDGNQCIPDLLIPQRTLIRGDRLCSLISAASVIAKVTRDHEMEAWHDQYPQYGFQRHKGYPTKEHKAALQQYGPCPIHRQSFAGVT